jgi:Diacylglycerol kinase catalytic domain
VWPFSPDRFGRPVHIAVVNNPASGNNRRGNRLNAILDGLRRSGVAHAEADSLDGLVAATQRLLADGVELVVVNGGDGTVQAVLTGIFRAPRTARVPILAVLPGGTTNTTARNVGYGARAEQALAELVAGAERGQLPGRVEKRPVLRIDRGSVPEPLYAMFFGAGAVYHGIRFSKDQVESRGLRGQLGAGLSLAVFLWRVVSGGKGELFPPLRASTTVDDGEMEREDLFGILASTMDRQFLGLRPYWGREAAPIHYSTLAYSVRSPVRAATAVMRGKPNRFVRPELGYKSCNAFRIELEIDSGFTLDGELFPADESTPLRLTADDAAHFLRHAPG